MNSNTPTASNVFYVEFLLPPETKTRRHRLVVAATMSEALETVVCAFPGCTLISSSVHTNDSVLIARRLADEATTPTQSDAALADLRDLARWYFLGAPPPERTAADILAQYREAR